MESSPIKQIGPTCGLYALYNGINYKIEDKIEDIYTEVLNLYNGNKFDPTNDKKEEYCYKTFVGEFFSVMKFRNFINSNFTDLRAEVVKVKNLEIDFNQSFYLFPLPLNKISGGCYDVLHWVTLVDLSKNEMVVLDSSKGRCKIISKNDLIEYNKSLSDSYFKWEKYRRSFASKYFKKDELNKSINRNLRQKKLFIKKTKQSKINFSPGEMIKVTYQ